MKIIQSIFTASAILFTLGLSAKAQSSDHSHEPTHGGIVQETSGYHVEMVASKKTTTFYLMDDKSKTVPNKSVAGSVIFEFSNKTKTSSLFKKLGKDAFEVPTPQANIITSCTVSFLVNGKQVTVKFKNNSVTEADIEHGHQH